MAHGAPLVCSDVGGLRELVVHGESGLLVPPRDPSALAETLTSLLRDPERRASLRGGGLRRADEFSVDRFVTAYDELYRGLLERTRTET
jgi:glycosyltransferase involved in cell wall biosynthesis